MWNIVKVLLKVIATASLADGIEYALHDPKQNLGDLLAVGFFAWLVWKMWSKKKTLDDKTHACTHCGVTSH